MFREHICRSQFFVTHNVADRIRYVVPFNRHGSVSGGCLESRDWNSIEYGDVER